MSLAMWLPLGTVLLFFPWWKKRSKRKSRWWSPSLFDLYMWSMGNVSFAWERGGLSSPCFCFWEGALSLTGIKIGWSSIMIALLCIGLTMWLPLGTVLLFFPWWKKRSKRKSRRWSPSFFALYMWSMGGVWYDWGRGEPSSPSFCFWKYALTLIYIKMGWFFIMIALLCMGLIMWLPLGTDLLFFPWWKKRIKSKSRRWSPSIVALYM